MASFVEVFRTSLASVTICRDRLHVARHTTIVCNIIKLYRYGGSTATVSLIFQNLQCTTTFRIVA
eukprot:4796995-Amphidinium_carterae.1